jgi:hypothetical protein
VTRCLRPLWRLHAGIGPATAEAHAPVAPRPTACTLLRVRARCERWRTRRRALGGAGTPAAKRTPQPGLSAVLATTARVREDCCPTESRDGLVREIADFSHPGCAPGPQAPQPPHRPSATGMTAHARRLQLVLAPSLPSPTAAALAPRELDRHDLRHGAQSSGRMAPPAAQEGLFGPPATLAAGDRVCFGPTVRSTLSRHRPAHPRRRSLATRRHARRHVQRSWLSPIPQSSARR